MIDSSSENPYQPPVAAPAAEVPVELGETTWPSVLGIIAIVFGTLGLMGGCWGGVSAIFLMEFFAQFATSMNPDMPDTVGPLLQFKASMIGLAIIAMVLGGWLLAVGIGLLKRRAWAPRATVVWSIVKMCLVVAQVIFQARMQQVQLATVLEQQADNAEIPFDMASLTAGIAIVGLVIGLVWGWALPVFFLFWFRRPIVRQEVRGWTTHH